MGARRGREVVQVYASRPDSAVERPPQWLVGFASAEVEPGEEADDAHRAVGAQLRALGRRRGRWQVEPGTYRLTAGPSSAEQGLITELDRGRVRSHGPARWRVAARHGSAGHATPDRSVAELARQLSLQTTELVRHEVELAKAELRVKGKRAGIGAGMFGGAGALGLYALGALTAAIIAGIAEALPVWAAALIVAALYGAVAGILALRGRSKVQQATPPVPEQTVQSVKEDVRYTKQRAQEARQ